MDSLISLLERSEKPREKGITVAIDTGLGLNAARDMLEICSDYVDIVKLAWGTSFITKNTQQKIALYKEYGIRSYLGGTFFELAYLQNKIEEYKEYNKALNLDCIEISNGVVDITDNEKIDLISDFVEDFLVLSEVGSKDTEKNMTPEKWVEQIKNELEAGAYKVIAEGRESGNAGLYRKTKEIRTELVDKIVKSVPVDKIIWETPEMAQQTWFIKRFGPHVNLGNIKLVDLIATETLRLGLRGDTLLHFHKKVPTVINP